MTKDEAVKKMQAVKFYMTDGNPIRSFEEMGEAFDMAIDALEQPERKAGKWIYIRTDERGNGLYQCSVCSKGDIHAPEVEVHYCWNCGAKMGTSHE